MADITGTDEFIEFRDYVHLRSRRVTFTMVEEFVEDIRDEVSAGDEDIRALSFAEDDLTKQNFELTNYMGLIGAKLSRGYALLRETNRFRDTLDQLLEDLINREYYEAANAKGKVPGANKEERTAYFASKYAMVYRSRRYLDDFARNELQEYINQLATMDKVLSRQLSSLEFEYNATTR